jgi:hypothetical protein
MCLSPQSDYESFIPETTFYFDGASSSVRAWSIWS